LLVVVQILVAQSQPIDALREHLSKRVLDQQRRPPVGETRRYALEQTDLPIGLAQQQRSAFARYLAGGETCFDAARKM
jgi:hypothetical protein